MWLNLLKSKDSLRWLMACSSQTYEGGVGGYPGVEAHGGYTFCAVATLVILDKIDTLDVHRLAVCGLVALD